ncbi:putative gustatory receptor 77a [Episyrphus balteatus]|uniref:putative gustatory receptor 77a n=1 Tax=Episyrphus balteatus TaxID=286459 RepID=UPI0024855CE8|nr:putative gustatory receptor 77a [Episyrphus balteatus]XP_055845004.1 putative gustatory receptor 77a [Episyrphus balteatus]
MSVRIISNFLTDTHQLVRLKHKLNIYTADKDKWFTSSAPYSIELVAIGSMFVFSKIFGKIFFHVCQFIGVIPFDFDFNSCTAKISNFWRSYTAVILIIITVFTPGSTSSITSKMDFLKRQRIMYFVGSNRCLVLHLCAILNTLIQLVKDRTFIYCCNECIRIFDSLRAISIDKSDIVASFDKSVMLRILVKLITLGPLTYTTGFYIVYDKALDDTRFLFALFSQYLCQLMIYMTVNILYGSTLVLTTFACHLNRSLKKTFEDIRVLKRQPERSNSFKMKKYCQYADALDRIIKIYKKVAVLTRLVNKQHQIQIFCFLIYISIECIVQCYIMYFVYTHLPGPHHIDWRLFIYISSLILELYVFINAGERLTNVFEETKWIVRMGAEIGRVDERLERMLEQFSIYLDSADRLKYSACGLLDLDNRCFMMIGQCLLTSLLILVQFDKILKY